MLVNTITDYLATKGIGTVGQNLFVGFLPTTEALATALYPTGGDAPNAREPLDAQTFQVRTRSTNPAEAADKLTAIYNELHGLSTVTLPDNTWLLSCVALQAGPVFIGRDEAGRSSFTLNFKATVRTTARNY